jgi:hypothetical protein
LTAVQDRWVSAAAGGAAASLLFFGALWLMFHQRRWAVAGAFTTLELWLLARALNPLAPDGFYHRPLALTKELAAAPHRLALAPDAMKSAEPLAGDNLLDGYHSLRQSLYPNVPLPHRVPQTWSHEVFGARRFVEYRRRVPDLPGPSAALDFLGTSHIVSIQPLPGPSRFLAQSANALLYTRPRPLERVTRVPRARVVPDDAERLKIIETGWDPRAEVLLEGPGPVEGSDGQTTEWAEEPGRVTARGQGAGWLVYSGVHAPRLAGLCQRATDRDRPGQPRLSWPCGSPRAIGARCGCTKPRPWPAPSGRCSYSGLGAFGWGIRKLRTF